MNIFIIPIRSFMNAVYAYKQFLQSPYKRICFIIVMILSSVFVKAQTLYKVGAAETYQTIASAYAAATISGANYIIEIQTDYANTETKPITFGTNVAASIIIRPSAAVTALTLTTTTTSLFSFSGGNNITIDGRPGGSGSSVLTLQNTAVTTGYLTVLFSAGSGYNTIQYCTISGANPSTATTYSGVIGFSTVSNNTIDHCTIQAVGTNKPGVSISSFTSLGGQSNNNTISNCNIVDFTKNGIYTTNPTAGWQVLNNNFYQSTGFSPISNVEMINFFNGSGFTISGNYMGGQAPGCAGAAYVFNVGYSFKGIYFASSSGTNTITNNTIQNINYAANNYGSVYALTGIHLKGAGNFTCGGSAGQGNTIGSMTASNSITFSNNATGGSAGFSAIKDSATGTQLISYNNIGGIQVSTGSSTHATDLIINYLGTTTVDNNIIGSTSALINNAGNASFILINNSSNNTFTVTNNTINGVSLTNTGSVFGLYAIKSSGTGNIGCSGNKLTNISSSVNALHSLINFPGGASNSTASFSANTISAITLSGTGTSTVLNVFDLSSPAPITVSGNTIGGTTASDISISGNALSSMITNSGSGALTASSNTIQNITMSSAGTSNNFVGIGNTVSSGQFTCTGNTITNISSGTASTSSNGCIYSVTTNGATLISKNTISNIAFTNTASVATFNSGVFLSCSTFVQSTVNKNIITGLSNASTSTSAKLIGIELSSGYCSLQNNVILLDNGLLTNGMTISGIDLASTGSVYIYYNTVKIGGSQSAASTTFSQALNRQNTASGGYTVYNNIFQNIRTGGTATTYHAAEVNLLTTGYTSNYNYDQAPAAGEVCYWPNSYYSFIQWQGSPAFASLSVSGTVTLDATGNIASAPFAGAGKGTTSTGVTDDITGATRSSTAPWIGAYEGTTEIFTSAIAPTSICAGAAVTVNYTVNGAFVGGNVFTAQLSSASGSFAAPVSIGTLTSTSSGAISTTIPVATAAGAGYRIRVVASNPATTGADNGTNLTINPVPAISSASSGTICSGVTQNYTITSAVASSYTWSRAVVAGISNTAATAQTTNPITEALVNTTNAPVTVVYQIIPTSTTGGCVGSTFSYSVTVNPTPSITSSSTGTVCSGSPLAYSMTSSIPSTYSWSRAAVTGISNTAVTAQSVNPITETLINTTTSPVTVLYQIIPTSTTGLCAGFSFTYAVTVNPLPVVTPTTPPAICSGSTVSIALASTPGGATFAWTTPVSSPTLSITGGSPGSTTVIAQTLTNTTTASATLTYAVSATLNGCTGGTTNIVQTVNPLPTISSASTGAICSGAAQNYNITSVVPSTYSWSRAAVTGISNAAVSAQTVNPITETLTNTTTGAITVLYQITPTSTTGSCAGSVFTYSVTVNPAPTVTSSATGTICSGVAQSYTISSSIPSTFSWSRAAVAGISNTTVTAQSANPITETLINTTTASKAATYIITPTSTAGSCTGASFNYVVTVNPSPTISSAATGTICSGVAQSYTITSVVPSTYTWSRALVSGISNAAATAQTTNPISETLTNTTNAAVAVTYIITPISITGNCTGTSFNYVVTVNPSPTISSAATGTICSGTAQSYSITSAVPSTYSWSRATVAGISNAAATAQTTNPITETLTNTTTAAVAVTYIITATSSTGSCAGAPFNYVVTVNPTPTISSTATGTICSGVAQSYSITSAVPSTYSWSRAVVAGISNAAATAQTANPITETLTNTTTAAIAVTYIITPTSSTGSCAGTPFNYVVTVNPSPVITSASTGTICSGSAQAYSITSNIPSTYSWSRAVVSGISNAAVTAQTANPITETLTNTTTAAVSVTYIITPISSTGSCAGTPFNYVVTVDPLPLITTQPSVINSTYCQNATATALSIVVTGTGLTYQWYSNTTASTSGGTVIAGATVSSYTPSTTTPGTSYYYCIVKTAFNCSVTSNVSGSIVIGATPTVNAGVAQSACANNPIITLAGSYTNATGVIWSGGSGTYVPNNTTKNAQYTPTPSEIAVGLVTLTLTTTGNGSCTAATGSVVLSYTPSPTVNAGTAPTVCANNPVATLSATVTNATSVSWSGGTGIFSNPTSANTTYTPSAAEISAGQTSNLKITATKTGCLAVSSTLTVTITPSPTANAGANKSICKNDSLYLTGSVTVATGGIWTSSGTGKFTPSTASLTPNYKPSNTDLSAGNVILTLTTTGNGSCNAVSSSMTLSFTPAPTVTVTAPTIICANNPVVNASATITSATGQTWKGNGGSFSPNTTAASVAYTLSPAEISAGVTKIIASTTGGSCPIVTDTVIITISPAPTVNAGADVSVCKGSGAVSLNGTTTNSSNIQWLSLGTGTFSSTTSLSTNYTPSSADQTAGQNKIVLKAFASTCTTVTDTLLITYSTAPVINAGPNASYCANVPFVPLNASGASGTWSGGSGTFTPSASTLNASYVPTPAEIAVGSLTLTIATPAGLCPVTSSSVTLTFKPVPVANPVSATSICSGTSTNNALSSIPTGASFAWTASLANGSVTFNPSGSGSVISQVLTGNGIVNYSVVPTLNGCSGTAITVQDTVKAPVISPASLLSGVLGVAYSQVFTVTNMTTPVWSASGTSLPSWLTFSSGGTLSGTPVSNGTFSFNITAAQGSCTITQAYSLSINVNSTTWNGTSWSNGIPNANTNAILNGNYTTTATETFITDSLIISSGVALTINGTATVTIVGSLINNGTINQQCTASVKITGSSKGNPIAIIQPVFTKPGSLPNGKINAQYSQGQPFIVSFAASPAFTAQGLPAGLSISKGSNVITGSTLIPGTFKVIITDNDGACMANDTLMLKIDDLTDPNLTFSQPAIIKTFGDSSFTLIAGSNSKAPITYSINPADTNCVSIDPVSGLVTIKCVTPTDVWVRATQGYTSIYKAETDSMRIIIQKEKPVVTLLTLPGLLIKDTVQFDYLVSAKYNGSASFSQSSGQQFAQLNTANSIIIADTNGSFNIELILSSTQNFTALDTIFTFTVYGSPQPPAALPDTIILVRKDGTVGSGSINLLSKFKGTTGHVRINLTDIDIINPGPQNIFFAPSIGTFEFDTLTGILSIQPTQGLTGTARLGYTITDANGITSSISYVTIEVHNAQDLPDLKANQVMTPNKDGKNDVLFIGYTDVSKNNKILILDQAGNTIYKANNYQNDWDGIDSNGNKVEAGVYFFVFNEEDGLYRELRNYVEVIR